ncbi:TlyA family RNA methyltransferase [Leptospira gomenensis]|uniref:TlyA family RNA methyltransferase n=1 Tax=Leptospira gomenensis TaxID=2484974 RepID=A0A5F1YQJ5_9LEPT|nr:TlyA family RNA methyltransferase [Leptospira gomenensis]TGK32743.1 TlyA family RNA methyltransferase [Leptospira gomenensis]TGK36890.1 TlyA family RNA methyltransferase [Leptospira gomenensis]TGK44362.1 TlyA family RNA methyltransferase [Leptospira gomenensis]TGK58855.1 TlyA family RNA methyltransferase [Leptospira gomenensis]
MGKEKIRLDALLLKKGLAETIEKARSLILSGSVLINEQKITKVGLTFSVDSKIRILNVIPEYVSRGAYKLLKAFETFPISAKGRLCVDLGASTGGFTQVLLEKGAWKVFSCDVGYGQLAERLRNHQSVVVKDRFHLKHLSSSEIEWEKNRREVPDPDAILIVMDLSFISLRSVFPVISRFSKELNIPKVECVSLVKPQFEVDERDLVKGVLRDSKIRFRIVLSLCRFLKREIGASVSGLEWSPIEGRDGNKEILLYWKP